MERTSYPWEKPQREGGLNPRLAVLVGMIVAAAAVVAVLFPPIEATHTGIPVSRKVSQLVYPATLVSEMSQPEGGTWLLPSGLARIGEFTFVLDTGNDRILKSKAACWPRWTRLWTGDWTCNSRWRWRLTAAGCS